MGKKANMAFLPNGYHTINGDIERVLDWNEYFVNTFVELAVNRFKWKNLPKTIDPRYVELVLLQNGSCVFFLDYLMGYQCLAGTYTGIDNYYNPTDYHIVTPTGYHANINVSDGMIIWNNFTRCSDMPTIWLYADSVAEIYSTMLVNVRGQKHPFVVVVDDEKKRLTMENAYAKLDGNHPVIYMKDKAMLEDNFTTIDAKIPFIAPDLFQMANKLVEEFLKWLGVKVPNIDKKERQIESEQRDKNAVTWQLRNRGLHARQEAAEKINARWGLNLEVEFNEEIVEYAEDLLAPVMGGLGGETGE